MDRKVTGNEGYEAQKKYCEENGKPLFVPSRGFCSNCGTDIFGKGGIDPETAGKRLITSCPFCRTSFCD